MLDQRYQRSEAGRDEIKARRLDLSRSARNLLLVLDGTRSGREWLILVQAATAADLAHLLEQGLIAVHSAAALPPPTLSPLTHTELYSYLTRHAKQYLGLIKGYRMVLEVERCADRLALQHLAQRFVSEVSQAHGEAVADQVRRALAIER